MSLATLPLFPLNTVLFPGGLLPLRIFEARYIDMVSRCMREESEFIICLIAEGAETGTPAVPEDIGVSVKIVDWESLPGGLLGITVLAQGKVRVLERDHQADGLVVVKSEPLPDEQTVPLPQEAQDMARLLKRILEEIPLPYSAEMIRMDSANWVTNRLMELLPFPHSIKQSQLVETAPLTRVATLRGLLRQLDLLG